jgi:hypothetical protein
MAISIPSVLSLVPPDSVRNMLRSSPAYVQNRDRAAAMLAEGFDYADAYERWRPWINGGSIAGMALSAFMLWKRRKKGAEAWAVWGTSFAANATVFWFTMSPLGSTPGEPKPASSDSGMIGWVDKKVAERKAEDPNFADAVFIRAINLPAIQPSWAEAPPLVQAVII